MPEIKSLRPICMVAATIITAACLIRVDGLAAADNPDGLNARGAVVWAQQCQRCHNMRDPTEFRDDQWRVIVTHMRIRGGLDGQQAREILAFLQASNGGYWDGDGATSYMRTAQAPTVPQGIAPVARSGKAVFEGTCIACHGQDGRGALPGVPDLTKPGGPLSKSDDVLRHSILEGVRNPEAPVVMPPKGGDQALSEADVTAVLAYLRTAFGGRR